MYQEIHAWPFKHQFQRYSVVFSNDLESPTEICLFDGMSAEEVGQLLGGN